MRRRQVWQGRDDVREGFALLAGYLLVGCGASDDGTAVTKAEFLDGNGKSLNDRSNTVRCEQQISVTMPLVHPPDQASHLMTTAASKARMAFMTRAWMIAI